MSTTVDLGKITASVTVGTTTTGAAGTNASVSNSGTTQDAVLNFTIPRGAQGVQGPQGSTGPQGPAGPTGPQGPMGDVAVITPEQQAAFTMYSETGQNTNGPMTQKAVTDALGNIAASDVSYNNSQSGTPANNVQDCIDILSNATRIRTEDVNISNLPAISFCINVGQAKWFIGNINTGAFTKHILVRPSEICRVTTTTLNRTRIFFLANYAPQDGASVNFIYKAQDANTTIDYVVPEGIHYIIFQDEAKLGNDIEIPSSIVKLDAVTDYMQEVQNEVVNINTAIYSTTDMLMANGASEKSYYTYSNGVISRQSSPSTYRSWNVNVLSKSLYALKIKFYLPAETSAKTFFTNDNNVKVGDFLSNETGDYVTYIIPEGATKLYWTVNYSTQTDIGMVGVVRNSFGAEKSSYNNSSAILSSNNVQGALSDIGNSIFELNQTRISAGQSTQQYFTYNSGVITKVSNSSFRCWNPIDITPYYAVSLKFYLSNSYAKSFFTNENNVMVGDFLTNTTGGYVNYVIPQGAKKLYWSADYNTQTDVSVYGLTRTKKDKEISILFIGNSLTQDAVSYTPLLLRELAPDIDFKFYMWYNGGYNLAQQLADFNNNVACDIFSVCESSGRWTNTNDSVTMQSVLSTYRFDVVCLQEYFNYQESANIEAFNGIIEYIENHYYHPFKVVTLFHQPKRDIAATVFDRTKTGNALILKYTVAEDMIPSGIAIYRSLSTSLDSLGDQGHLSPDGTHAQEGLPCMMQAYVTAMWVMKQVGTQMSVNNAATIVDNNNYDSINVPGPNLGTGIVIGTTEQVRLSQKVAIQSFKEGEYFVNANLTEYTT